MSLFKEKTTPAISNIFFYPLSQAEHFKLLYIHIGFNPNHIFSLEHEVITESTDFVFLEQLLC